MLGRLTATFGNETLSTSKHVSPGAEVLIAERDDAELRQRAKEALKDHEIADADFDVVVAELAGLRADTNNIQTRIVSAGNHIAKLREKAGEGGFRALHAAGLIPVSEAAASKLVRIWQAVETRSLPIDRMPQAIEAAYLAAKLPEASLQQLMGSGILKPEATVREIRAAVAPPAPAKAGRGPLHPAERRRLERLRDRLRARLTEIETRLRQG
jgi:hypothetical protein